MSRTPLAEKLVNDIDPPQSRALLGIGSVAAEIARAKLESRFPRSISGIESLHNFERDERWLVVRFKNGHHYKCIESELFSQYSLATMSLLYDLTSLGDRGDT